MRVFEGYQKGVNLGGWVSQCVEYTEEHYKTFITEQDIKDIAAWGLDHVRLPIDYDVFMTEEGEFIEARLTYIDNCIQWCKNAGIHMILDLHKTFGYMFDTNEVAAPDLFFDDIKLQDKFVEIWQFLAKRYSVNKDMMSFELLNEVVNPAVEEKWCKIASRAIGAIREIDKDVKILVGGVKYNNVTAVSGIKVPVDENIVFNFHCYDPLLFTHQKAYWVDNMPSDFEIGYPKTVEEYREAGSFLSKSHAGAVYESSITEMGAEFFDQLFQDAVAYAKEKNVPLYCGEYGVIDQAPLEDTVRWFEDIHSIFVKYGIGRSLWNYKNKDFGLVDEHYAPIKEELIKNL